MNLNDELTRRELIRQVGTEIEGDTPRINPRTKELMLEGAEYMLNLLARLQRERKERL